MTKLTLLNLAMWKIDAVTLKVLRCSELIDAVTITSCKSSELVLKDSVMENSLRKRCRALRNLGFKDVNNNEASHFFEIYSTSGHRFLFIYSCHTDERFRNRITLLSRLILCPNEKQNLPLPDGNI